jgi:hypothetical protein
LSSLVGVAGVAIAGYQALWPQPAQREAINVTVALDPPVAATTVEKSDAAAMIAVEEIDLARGASISAALKDGTEGRYDFAALVDGRPETYLTLAPPDSELNVLVTFSGLGAQDVTAISYAPPAGIDPAKLASVLDVAVLPEGEMGAAGRPVYTFALQTSPGSQTFAIPGRASGRGVWLRVAGPPGSSDLAVGDFRIVRETIAP